MILFGDLYHLDVTKLKAAADRWQERIRFLQGLEEAYVDGVVSPFDAAGWNSGDATSAVAWTQVRAAGKEFGDACAEAKGIRAVLRDAHDELKKCKSDLHELVREAKGHGVIISDTGKVSFTESDGYRDQWQSPVGVQPVEDEEKASYWQGRIDRILSAATDVDQSAAAALKRNAGKRSEGFNDKTTGSIDQDEAQRASKILKKYESGGDLSPGELKEIERLMRHNQKDPEFSRMLLNDLGPETTLRLAEDLNKVPADGAADKRPNGLQGLLANSIATANGDKDFSGKWRKEMKELGAERPEGKPPRPYNYQTLTTLLKEGDTHSYPAEFTKGLTDDIIAVDRDNPGLWDEHELVEGNAKVDRVEVKDPLDDMLGIMSDSPKTATEYLDPGDPAGKKRMEYLLEERDWPDQEVRKVSARDGTDRGVETFDATNSRVGLGVVIEAATTGARPGAEKIDFGGHTEAQARVMQETIHLLDTETDDKGKVSSGHGDVIPKNMHEPLARALSDYTADTHDIIAGTKPPYDDDGGQKTIVGSGDNARIANSEVSVIRVLRGVSDEPKNFAQIYESERFYAAELMADTPQEPGRADNNWKVPARDIANVLGTYNGIGTDVDLDKRDERKQWADDVAKQRYHMRGAPLSVIPYVGDAAQRVVDQHTYDWSKDVKASEDEKARGKVNEANATGTTGAKLLIDTWVDDRNRHGSDISDTTRASLKQYAESDYLTHRNHSLRVLRGEF